MSDSPIFDALDSERGFTRMNEEAKKALQRYTHPLIARVVPVVEEEEEVLAKPFVEPQGVPRGTFGQAIGELINQTGIELTATVLGVPVPIVEDQISQYEPVRHETTFDPMELVEKGKTFTNFALETLDEFKLENPAVDQINFFIDTDYSFERSDEKFVITGRKPKIQNPDEVLVRPLKGVDLEDTMPAFGVQLIGAQDVPGDVLAAYRRAVAEQHPGFVIGAITAIEEHEDGSATLTMTGQEVHRPKTLEEAINVIDASVKPLSEKNTAQHME